MSGTPEVPVATIAGALTEGRVIPFVGAAASFVGVPDGPYRLPDGVGLTQRLLKGRREDYPGEIDDPLTTVSQYLEEALVGRGSVYALLRNIFYPDAAEAPISPTAQFLAELPKLELVISTNYDDQVERALAASRPPRPYVVVTHVTNRYSKHYPSMAVRRSDSDEAVRYLTDREFLLSDYADAVIVYKMHGTFGIGLDEQDDTLVLTEHDYVRRLMTSETVKIPPSALTTFMQSKHLLFLGYSLRDWNFRVTLLRLQEAGMGFRSWAVQHPVSPVEEKFWDRREISVYDVDLAQFIASLRDRIRKTQEGP